MFSLFDSFVDPSAFLESLGIQTNEQQDAQEFNKLFISLLDASLLAQGIDIIDQQFGGTYCYQTQCGSCNAISERPSKFYELDLNIKGHSTLHKCLKDFLKEEILEGDNQYFCCQCQGKRNATRKIVLKKLPRVLNLQLLRFVFERYSYSITSSIFVGNFKVKNIFLSILKILLALKKNLTLTKLVWNLSWSIFSFLDKLLQKRNWTILFTFQTFWIWTIMLT